MFVACALDQIAIEGYIHPYTNRPPTVLAMLKAVITSPTFRALPVGTFRVLLALVARVPRQAPGDPFIARASRCAIDAATSTKTVSRAIVRFVQEGWLEVTEERLPSGQYAAGSFKATGALFTVLSGGIVVSPPPSRYAYLMEQELANNTSAPIPSDNDVSRLSNVDLQIKEDQTRLSHPQQAIESSVREDLFIKPKPQKQDPHYTPLPPDVAPLGTVGIHPLMAYRLMGMASSAGHRLGDLVTVAMPHLKRLALTGWRAYRYVLRMISKTKVGYAERAREAEETHVRKEQNTFLDDAAKRYEGQAFLASSGAVIWIEKGRARIVKSDGSVWGCAGVAMVELFQDIVAGVLRPMKTTKLHGEAT